MEFLTVNESSKPAAFDTKQIWAALRQCIISNFGDTGWGAVGLSLTGKVVSKTDLQV